MQAQRYPISIRLIGVMHKEKSKMYMTSVLWSDQNDIIVYRSFREFKNMHKKMKKAFPPANPMKKSSRIVPAFGDKKTKRSAKGKSPGKSVVRLKLLEKYCNDLLSCDPRVTQSPDVLQFFNPKSQDLEPEFSKNSIMIMPSDATGDNGGHASVNTGNVTQPFVTETYRCVAPYETKDTKNRPFKVAVDEKVDVLIKDKAGWWLVESEDKRLAWFPAPYLEKVDDDDDYEDEVDMDENLGTGALYTAIKTYKATKEDELSVDIGSVVEVIQKSDNGWWLIRYNNKAGYIPTMYLKPHNNPLVRMAALQPGLRGSTLDLSQLRAPSPGQLRAPSPGFSPGLSPGLSHQFSHSQGNLLHLPGVRPSTPVQLQPADKHKSRSLNILSEPRPARPAASPVPSGTDTRAANAATHPRAPAPTIMVEMDGEEDRPGRSPTESEGSLGSLSSEFSVYSSSSGSSSLNLSLGHTDERLRLSRTPPPMSNRLSPHSGAGATMMPSVSDPNLYKGPSSPKVPPRPQAQQILSRCTTITRKNAAKGALSPVQPQILSR